MVSWTIGNQSRATNYAMGSPRSLQHAAFIEIERALNRPKKAIDLDGLEQKGGPTTAGGEAVVSIRFTVVGPVSREEDPLSPGDAPAF